MEERREINRVDYERKSIIVLCDTYETIDCETTDVSPMGMGAVLPADAPDIMGKDIIIVASTVIMYAEAVRKEVLEDGRLKVGISAKPFTDDVLQYLFDSIKVEN